MWLFHFIVLLNGVLQKCSWSSFHNVSWLNTNSLTVFFSGRGQSQEHPITCNCSLQEDRVRLSHSSRHNPCPTWVRWTRFRNFFLSLGKISCSTVCLYALNLLVFLTLKLWEWPFKARPSMILAMAWIQLNSPRLDIRGRGIRLVVSARWQKMVTVLFTGVWGEGLSRPYCKVGFEGIFWMRLSHCWALTFPRKVVHISSRIGT